MRNPSNWNVMYYNNSQVEAYLDGTKLDTVYVGASPYAGVDQINLKIPSSLAGTPRAASFYVRSQYDPAAGNPWFVNGVEWKSEIKDFLTTGDTKNILKVPIR